MVIAEGSRIPYTPSGVNVSARDVIVQNQLVAVAIEDIADGKTGALSCEGLFWMPKLATIKALEVDRLSSGMFREPA